MENHLKPYLMEHPLFKWLDSRYVSFIAQNASHESFDAGERILTAGEEANRFYIIIHGEVTIESPSTTGARTEVQRLTDGEVLGWSWLVPPHQWQFDACATKHTTTFALDADAIRTRCEEDHDLGYELMKRFSSVMLVRLHAFRKRCDSLSVEPS